MTISQSHLILNLKNNSETAIKIGHVAAYNTILTFDLINPDACPIVLETGSCKRIFLTFLTTFYGSLILNLLFR